MSSLWHKFEQFWLKKRTRDKIIFGVSLIALIAAAIFIVAHQVFLTPDQFYGLAFIVVIFTGQIKSFIWDWTPPLILLLSYEYLRGLIPQINHTVHYTLMPRFDLLLFGKIPGTVLQRWLYTPNHFHWYDYASVTIYLMHFVIPELIAFVFWMTDRAYFKEYILGIVALSYLTFLTYLVFPAAPPWMASQMGLISPVQHLTNLIVGHFFHYVAVPNVYGFFGINLTAAVPSLHAAFPFFTALYIGKKYPRTIPILILYVLSVWFAVMYLGEHYFFDIVLGTIYAMLVYVAIQRFKHWRANKKQKNSELAEPALEV